MIGLRYVDFEKESAGFMKPRKEAGSNHHIYIYIYIYIYVYIDANFLTIADLSSITRIHNSLKMICWQIMCIE